MVPPDLHYLRNRIKKRGDKSVSFFSAATISGRTSPESSAAVRAAPLLM